MAAGFPWRVVERAYMGGPPQIEAAPSRHCRSSSLNSPAAGRPTTRRGGPSRGLLEPGLGEQLARVREQLREGLGAADDRHEVLVTRPARDHVLMEVGGDAGTRDVALVHA